MKHPIMVYRDEQRRFALEARKRRYMLADGAENLGKTAEQAYQERRIGPIGIKAMAAQAMMQMEIKS